MLKNYNLSYTTQNHSSVTRLKQIVYSGLMNITADFQLPSMIPTRDTLHHNINTETSLAIRKIIQA